MKYLKTLGSALLAGLCIALGGTVFLSVESKPLGAFLFAVGLFTICSFGFHLFTGKVCYAPEKDRTYWLELPVIWVGNFLGTAGVAGLLSLTRVGPALAEKAAALCAGKLADGLWSLFVLGIFCNILIYIAVEGHNTLENPMGRYIALFMGVMVFILCGTEHCVADMFYFAMAGEWSGRMLLCLAVITGGNALGGILIRTLHRWVKKGNET